MPEEPYRDSRRGPIHRARIILLVPFCRTVARCIEQASPGSQFEFESARLTALNADLALKRCKIDLGSALVAMCALAVSL